MNQIWLVLLGTLLFFIYRTGSWFYRLHKQGKRNHEVNLRAVSNTFIATKGKGKL